MPSESPFSKLPSLSELLGHPAVAQVVKRVNQSTVAQRATGFLEELQSNLRQRFEQGNVPSLGQLAERFARRLLGPSQTSAPAVNATGVLLSERWSGLPMAEPSVDEIVRLAGEYHPANSALSEKVNHSLREINSAEGVLVVSHFDAALEILQKAGLSGTVPPYAGFLDPGTFGHSPYATISERLRHGAELVVVDGAGLIGGPSCGIIIGKREMVEQATNVSSAASQVADLTLAALAATLTIYQQDNRAQFQIPLWQLLSAPLENLEHRANRLATLIGASSRIESATATTCEYPWCNSHGTRLSGRTWAVVVKPLAGEFHAIATSLSETSPPILPRLEAEEIWLDLRGVFPRWDQHLVISFE